MSIRARLMIICLVVALLPAIPLTFLVRGLIEKSFNVGLSETVSGALESGIEVSRMHLEQIRLDFEKASAGVAGGDAGTLTDTTLVVTESTSVETAYQTWKGALLDFGSRSPLTSVEYDLTFYESTDRSVEAARLRGAGGKDLVIFREVPADFLEGSRRIIEGNQTFARLDLASGRLAVSFFYPFVIIYGVVLIIALLFAFVLAERLAGPIRRLERAAAAVAAGDWTVQVREKSGGETGRLVQRFNEMVSRLDAQRRRLADMDKISSWREMARHLAHEIKNPILPIRLTVQELKDQYPGGDEKYGDFLGESVTLIEGELSSLQALVKEFSSFARLPGLSLKEGSLTEVAGSVAALYPGSIARITADPDLP
ncbi:MAG TPA: HAMP domain-containing protein, partial [Candidatus Krumholzibacterium sp.]|nr:HAMP domain-containing protein [Candidatus Krumholzibacterium sp.]